MGLAQALCDTSYQVARAVACTGTYCGICSAECTAVGSTFLVALAAEAGQELVREREAVLVK